MTRHWIAVLSLSFCGLAQAQTLAIVNGQNVTEPSVKAWLMTQGIAAPSAEQIKQALPVFENRVLLSQQAEKGKIVSDKTLEPLIEAYKINILSQAEVEHYLSGKQAAEAKIKARYEALKANQPAKLYRIRMIVLRNTEDADTVLAKLKNGASFSNLAAQYSADQASAMLGGELGWRALPTLPPAVDSTVLKLKDGQVAGPIQVNDAYVVIQLMQTKDNDIPTLEALRSSIVSELNSAAVNDYVLTLRKQAKILPGSAATGSVSESKQPTDSSPEKP